MDSARYETEKQSDRNTAKESWKVQKTAVAGRMIKWDVSCEYLRGLRHEDEQSGAVNRKAGRYWKNKAGGSLAGVVIIRKLNNMEGSRLFKTIK